MANCTKWLNIPNGKLYLVANYTKHGITVNLWCVWSWYRIGCTFYYDQSIICMTEVMIMINVTMSCFLGQYTLWITKVKIQNELSQKRHNWKIADSMVWQVSRSSLLLLEQSSIGRRSWSLDSTENIIS